jgi:hypothetical protein
MVNLIQQWKEQVYRQKMTVKVMKYDESFYNILIRSGLAFK